MSAGSGRPPGAIVLGMHRSGTSVVAGVLDKLGLDGGDPATMFDADEFNSDGYWEQRPIVELHDRLLRELGGFASAPPDPAAALSAAAADEATAAIDGFLGQFERPWFVKDPRHCLLVPAWAPSLRDDDVAVVVFRDPNHVVRSLRHRNGYSVDVAAGLWETYTSSLLRSVDGRDCVFVHYDELLDDPPAVIEPLAHDLAQLGLVGLGADRSDDACLVDAVALVRPRDRASSSTATTVVESLQPEQRVLQEIVGDLRGVRRAFTPPVLPRLAPSGQQAIARRRRRLRVVDAFVGRSASQRARFDRRVRPAT